MSNLNTHIENYLEYCKSQKRLDPKTIKAYRIDLNQFYTQHSNLNIFDITADTLETYIATLHNQHQPKTVKRKIASLKALFHYFEYREIIEINPFNKIRTKFREPIILPKTIPLNIVEKILITIYKQRNNAKTYYQRRNALRDAAVIELLFATGIRISELCSIKEKDVSLYDGTILIYGKGSKERQIQIVNNDVSRILEEYNADFSTEIENCGHFFANQLGKPLSDQSVRRIIKKYTSLASVDLHITPHMFRHTFATSLLDADVDIRFIQEMLGHSSIHITEVYTHVTTSKQRNILTNNHPRKCFHIIE